ncbi:DUF305 domain-containing protein [Allosaccharopolyspora coralli]|uniref:DUF305 domain-containing protein n=2 Tax=Allosaccharopolyspora coralli TaxID=2665642 RepID=A0A5Q3QLU6_9PSEU|nr:DUF305 domain-containing protein [Allosaccharopolyspora coralli]
MNDSDNDRRPAWARVLVAVGAGLSLLLVGATLGLLLKIPSTGTEPEPTPVDIGFAQDMTHHHQQAVTMATLARQHGNDQAVRQLAFDIETNQRNQIGRMQGWLSVWGRPAQAPGPPMRWMHGATDGHDGHGGSGEGAMVGPDGRMPGMATSDELAELRSLRGQAFDVRFLQLMLRHHEGGAGMARSGAEQAAVPAVRGLATNMLTAQAKESDVMRGMLSARNTPPLPLN